MKVEIWSDVVCPFCYIGKRRFEQALQQFNFGDEVEVTFKSFQLDPTVEKGQYDDIHQMLANKYQVPYEQGKEMNAQMAQQAKEVGLEFNFDSVVPTNTEDAHRLSQFAKQEGKLYELMEELMKAYFTKGLDVGDHEVLLDTAGEVGLDREEASNALESGAYLSNVRRDQQEASQIGVQGVPFFVFNEKYAVSGAQSTESFLEVLNKVYEEEKSKPQVQMLNKDSKTEYCDGDSC
ncbi:putative DsbA family dithiol-disulfide isomerase [Alkalibacillus filiformis]|uniref:DsbA family dithiol-disulfide isomerase n=1 Tax=Alkalibacillus filiformis TaxID=200990 RepID=A0ABU0DSL0_9BACI|nr:DsbA family oxidoreductase [Alkalibacillus filiformis]MDQ0351439.1 putative DsbA family dithiol-disulfide isomerase [Alkalibacillus filiformis]